MRVNVLCEIVASLRIYYTIYNDITVRVCIHNALHNKALDSKVRRTLCAFLNVFNAFLSEYIYLLGCLYTSIRVIENTTEVHKIYTKDDVIVVAMIIMTFQCG